MRLVQYLRQQESLDSRDFLAYLRAHAGEPVVVMYVADNRFTRGGEVVACLIPPDLPIGPPKAGSDLISPQ